VADLLKWTTRSKPDRGIIRRVYAADHDVLPQAESQRKQRLDKGASDASSTNVLSDMHPMRDRVAVSRPRTSPIPESGEAENITPGSAATMTRNPALNRSYAVQLNRLSDTAMEE
jgi:hypothetical protein